LEKAFANKTLTHELGQDLEKKVVEFGQAKKKEAKEEVRTTD
jgi:hypothetical protein